MVSTTKDFEGIPYTLQGRDYLLDVTMSKSFDPDEDSLNEDLDEEISYEIHLNEFSSLEHRREMINKGFEYFDVKVDKIDDVIRFFDELGFTDFDVANYFDPETKELSVDTVSLFYKMPESNFRMPQEWNEDSTEYKIPRTIIDVVELYRIMPKAKV